MGIGRFIKKAFKAPFKTLKSIISDPTDIAGHTMAALGIDPPKEPGAPKKPDVLAMPDQEEQKRLSRRNAARRRGGRASTILTGQDTLG